MAENRNERDETAAQMKALGHGLRRRIMAIFVAEKEGPALSPRQVAATLQQPLANVSYHVRVLAECEAIELVGTQPVRGSMQHFYLPSERFIESPLVAFVLGIDAAAEAA